MPEPLPLPHAIGWVGTPLADVEAEAVGEVQSVYIDSISHEPSWVVAKLPGEGRRGRWARIVAIPAAVCAGAPGAGVWAAVDAAHMRPSQVFAPARQLLREHELTLCDHDGTVEEGGRADAVADQAE